jgi:hypothetical protein
MGLKNVVLQLQELPNIHTGRREGGVGSHKQGRFVLTDPILRKENDGRPTGKGVAGTVTPGNIEVENTSTGVGLAGADMP